MERKRSEKFIYKKLKRTQANFRTMLSYFEHGFHRGFDFKVMKKIVLKSFISSAQPFRSCFVEI